MENTTQQTSELDDLHQSRSSRRRETSEQLQVAAYSHSTRVEKFHDYAQSLLSGTEPEIAAKSASQGMSQDPEMRELSEMTHMMIQQARKKKGHDHDMHGTEGLLFTISARPNGEKLPIEQDVLKEILSNQLAKAYALEHPKEVRAEIEEEIKGKATVEIEHMSEVQHKPSSIELANKELKETIESLQNEYHKLSDEKEAYLRQGKLSYTEEQWKAVNHERQNFSSELKEKYGAIDGLIKEWQDKPMSEVNKDGDKQYATQVQKSFDGLKDRLSNEISEEKVEKDKQGNVVKTPIDREEVLKNYSEIIKTGTLNDAAKYITENTNISAEKFKDIALSAGTLVKEDVKSEQIESHAQKTVEAKTPEVTASERAAVIREMLFDGRDGENSMHKAFDKAHEQSEKLGDQKLTNIIKEFEKDYMNALTKEWDAGHTGTKVLLEAYTSNMDDKKKAEFIETNEKSVSLEAKQLRDGKMMYGTEPAIADIIAKRQDLAGVRLETEITRLVNREMAVDHKILQNLEMATSKNLNNNQDRIKNLVEELATRKGIDVSQHDLEKHAIPVQQQEKSKAAEMKM